MAPKSQTCSILHKCKYCTRRFTGINGGYRFYSHLRHHELNIKPYWYKKPTPPISQMKQETGEIISTRNDTGTKGPTDSRSGLKLRFSLQKEEKNLTYKVTLVESEAQVANALSANDEAGVGDSPSYRKRSIDQLKSHQENLNPRPRSRNVTQKSVNMKDRTNVEDISKASTGANERPAHRHCGDTCQSSRASNGKTSNEGKPAKKRYHCRYCPRCFSQNGGLVIHERIHLGHTPFTCDICDVSFYDKSNLRKHQRTHNGNKIYKCQFCDKSFSDGSNLKKHENSHTLKKTFKCSYCDRLLTSKAGKQNHELIHTGLKPFPCSFCGRNFRFQRDLLNHNRLHTGERPHKCHYENCDAAFIRAYQLTCHIRQHEGVKPYKCGLCERRFITGASRNTHEASHYEEFKCAYCPRVFGSKSGKLSHEFIQHIQGGKKLHACTICGKTFTCPYHRNKHEKEHVHWGLQHKCPREGCSVWFSDRRSIATHLVTCHLEEDKPCRCGSCGRLFATEYIKFAHEQNCISRHKRDIVLLSRGDRGKVDQHFFVQPKQEYEARQGNT